MKYFTILFVLIISLSCQTRKQQKDVAVMFRGNAAHSGKYSNPTIDTLHGTKWKTLLEGNVLSSPAIYKDVAYIGGSEKFYALNADTGKQIWSIDVEGPAHSSPAVYNDIVYFGDFSGKFYAVNAIDGSIKWTFYAEGERRYGAKGIHGMEPQDQYFEDDWDFFNSSPTIKNNKIYFGSGNGKIYGLELETGNEIWSFQTGEVSHTSPAVAYGNVYAGSWDSNLYCLDAETGKQKWKYQAGIDTVYFNQVGVQSSPLVADSTVYFGCRDAHIYALNAISGELKWKKNNNMSWIIVSPVIDEENIYYTTSDSQLFIALNRHTGDSLYSLPTRGFGFSSPILLDDMIYFGVFNGDLVAVDTKTQSEAWRFQTDEAKEDIIQVLKEDGTLNGEKVFADFSADKMPQILEMMYSVGAILSTPVPYKNSLIFGTADGHVYAIN